MQKMPKVLDLFLPETNTKVGSFDEALEVIETDYSYDSVPASLKEVKVGNGTMAFRGHEYQATMWSLQSVWSLVGLSKPTAYRLDLDDLIKFIETLSAGQHIEVAVLIDKKQSKIVNVVKIPHHHVSNRDALKTIGEIDSKYSWSNTDILINERGIQLSLVTESLGTLEPVKGDITETGFFVVNSETGDLKLRASIFLYRLVCQNGLILKKHWGDVRWTHDRKTKTALRAFKDKIKDFELSLEALNNRYSDLVTNRLTDIDFRKLWRKLSSLIGPQDADTVLEVKEEARKTILKELKQREENNRKDLNAEVKVSPVELEKTQYHTLQLITEKAQRYPFPIRQQMQRLGGKIIDLENLK